MGKGAADALHHKKSSYVFWVKRPGKIIGTPRHKGTKEAGLRKDPLALWLRARSFSGALKPNLKLPAKTYFTTLARGRPRSNQTMLGQTPSSPRTTKEGKIEMNQKNSVFAVFFLGALGVLVVQITLILDFLELLTCEALNVRSIRRSP
jgi:hypothetical protein